MTLTRPPPLMIRNAGHMARITTYLRTLYGIA